MAAWVPLMSGEVQSQGTSPVTITDPFSRRRRNALNGTLSIKDGSVLTPTLLIISKNRFTRQAEAISG